MLWVLVFFFFAYGSLHAYLFLKVQLALRLPRRALAGLAAFLLLMIFSILLIRGLERSDHVTAARLLGWVAYPWAALIFWFCVLALLTDFWNLAMRLTAKVLPAARRLILPAKPTLIAVGIGVVLFATISLFEANRIEVREINIQTPLLPAGSAPIRVLQFSDLHLSIHRGPRLLQQFVERVREINPDVLISTGDLVDSDARHIEQFIKPLAELNPPLGKFAVLGNHEYYWNAQKSLEFHRAAGFRVLRQEFAAITPAISLVGVDDRAGHYTHQPCLDDEATALDSVPRNAFTILLKHQPLVSQSSINRFDLQLSGHIHDGQVFPFQLVIRFLYPFFSGVHRLGSRSLLNVSRGVGTWGPAMRLGARPEICLITIEPAVDR